MIMSHLNYCITSWTLTNKTTIKTVEALYKKALKVLDEKPNMYHHCRILEIYNLLNWDNLIKLAGLVLVYKILNGQAPPPLNEFLKRNSRTTRAGSRGDCLVPFRKSVFGQLSFSFRASQTRNTVPASIRDLETLSSFTKNLKKWLFEGQTCNH